MGDFLSRTLLLNRRAKFDAASFILSSPEKSVTVQNYKQTNSKRYIYTLPIGMSG